MGASVNIQDNTINEIRFGDPTAMDGATAITTACWVNLESYSGNREYFLAKWANFGTMDYSLGIDGSSPNETIEMMIRNGTNYYIRKSNTLIASAMALDAWYFVTFSWDYNSGSPVFFHTINGVEYATSPRSTSGTVTSIGGSASTLRVGGISDASYNLDGNICYVHIYNRALSIEEIKEIMYKPGSVTLNLIHFMPLIDYSTFIDIQGDAVNGTITGTVTESTDGPPIQFY